MMRPKMDYIQPTDPPKMGEKCPLELLQMTCASIGRESPKPAQPESKKRKLDVGASGSKFTESKIMKTKEDVNQNNYTMKVDKEDSPTSKLAKLSPERKFVTSPRTGNKAQSPVVMMHSASSIQRPKSTSSSERARCVKTASSPVIQNTSGHVGLQSSNALLNPNLLQSAELDRYLRASASLYSATTLQHPALSAAAAACYPSGGIIPGLLPSMPYMPYFTGYPQTALGLSAGMNALFPTLQPSALHGLGSTATSLSSDTPQHDMFSDSKSTLVTRTCDWANCGKKFSTPEQLAEHVKEHVTSAIPNTMNTLHSQSQAVANSSKLGVGAAHPNPMTLPRFSPYITSYPRDLLNSRFVYS